MSHGPDGFTTVGAPSTEVGSMDATDDRPTPFPELDDAAVCTMTRRMVDGDRMAYEQLFRARCAFVEREASRRLHRRPDLADDAGQEAWLRVARAPRHCTSVVHLDAWLRRIITSTVIDLIRSELARDTRERRFAHGRSEAIDLIERFDDLEEMRRELEGMNGWSRDDRLLVELQIRTGATLTRIAGWLGIGRAALDSRIRRAIERARARQENA